jgi:aminoglycoside phosphotransferase (APT) family kinase protein
MTVSVDAPAAFDVAALDEWIGDRLPGRGDPLRATRMGAGTGEANALYWLCRGDQVWVLRRPPAVINAPGASDMLREWRILTALEGTSVPHAVPLLLGGPDSPLGAPFLIMDRVDGFTPVGVLRAPYDTHQGRRELSFALVDALVDLAGVPWQARGLDGLGKPDGFLDRQVARWLGQLEGYRTRDIPELDWVAGWLEANRPAPQPPGLMHGDYSPYNVMASPRDTTRLAAVVDWDTGTIGDPLLDLGHLLARWTEPGEEPAIGVWDIDVRAGLASRAERARLRVRQGRPQRPHRGTGRRVRPAGPGERHPARCRAHRHRPGLAGRDTAAGQHRPAARPGRPARGPGRDGAVAGQPGVPVGHRGAGARRRRPLPADQLTQAGHGLAVR